MTTEIHTATVKFAAQREPLQTTNGPRINCVFTLESGEEVKVWGDPDDIIGFLSKGEKVSLVKTKNSWKVASQVGPATGPAGQPMQPTTEPRSEDVRQLLLIYLEIQACLPQIKSEDIREMAIALYRVRVAQAARLTSTPN